MKGKENNIQRLNNIIRGLKHFEYPDFDDEFLTNLEIEIQLAVKHVNKEFDWNSIKETHNIKIRIDRKIKKLREGDWTMVTSMSGKMILERGPVKFGNGGNWEQLTMTISNISDMLWDW